MIKFMFVKHHYILNKTNVKLWVLWIMGFIAVGLGPDELVEGWWDTNTNILKLLFLLPFKVIILLMFLVIYIPYYFIRHMADLRVGLVIDEKDSFKADMRNMGVKGAIGSIEVQEE